jgi:hypothetical protein
MLATRLVPSAIATLGAKTVVTAPTARTAARTAAGRIETSGRMVTMTGSS